MPPDLKIKSRVGLNRCTPLGNTAQSLLNRKHVVGRRRSKGCHGIIMLITFGKMRLGSLYVLGPCGTVKLKILFSAYTITHFARDNDQEIFTTTNRLLKTRSLARS